MTELPAFGYPDDYQDPPFDGTTDGFRDTVLPARIEALQRSLNEAYAGLLPEGCRFEWVSDSDPEGTPGAP